MKAIKTATFAALLGALGAITMTTGEAAAQAAVDYKDAALLPAVMPTDQRGDFVAGAYGDLLGREGGEANGLIGLLRPAGITDGTSTDRTLPAVQNGGLVNEAYGDVLGREGEANGLIGLLKPAGITDGTITDGTITDGTLPAVQNGELVPAVTPTDRKGGKLTSLMGVGSANDLFLGNRTGGAHPLLLPAVQKVREAASATQGVETQGAGPHVNPGALKGLNFTNNANQQTGGAQINPGAVKGLNFTNTRK